ncbi:MAG TPA: helix-turn-helix transcriptional regulator [Bacteroidia bacterium]|nr:helix-turn-helix transcriptional regulator [Bacteroidia bacterium]HNP98942.1 helix-turn-helix transcriptional regulator [Bacteroidia bacterium]
MNNDKFLYQLGSKIKAIRSEKNMTQQVLAKRCGFEKSSLSRIESGQINITVLTLKKIGRSLKTPIVHFFK